MREGQSNFERLEASLKNHNKQLLCSIIAEKQRFVIVFPWTAAFYCFSMDSCLLLFFHGQLFVIVFQWGLQFVKICNMGGKRHLYS